MSQFEVPQNQVVSTQNKSIPRGIDEFLFWTYPYMYTCLDVCNYTYLQIVYGLYIIYMNPLVSTQTAKNPLITFHHLQ